MRHTNEERVEVHTGRGTAEIILGCACGADGKESAHQIESGDRRVSVTRRRSNISSQSPAATVAGLCIIIIAVGDISTFVPAIAMTECGSSLKITVDNNAKVSVELIGDKN